MLKYIFLVTSGSPSRLKLLLHVTKLKMTQIGHFIFSSCKLYKHRNLYTTVFGSDCHKMFDGVKLFPIEVDLARTAFMYNAGQFQVSRGVSTEGGGAKGASYCF